jgi:multiple sugar transport system permease protein
VRGPAANGSRYPWRAWVENGVALLVTLTFLFPLFWMLATSFKPEAEIFKYPARLLPIEPTLRNYRDIVTGNYHVLRSFGNSFLVAIVSMAISLVLSVPTAYSFARFGVKGRKGFLLVFLVSQMLPPTLTLTPLYIMFNSLRLVETLYAPILACASVAIPFTVLTLRTYFLSLPGEIEEAALLDGCTTMSTFVKIILPISYPGVIVAAAFSFVFGWNNLIYSMTFIADFAKWPATAGMFNFINEFGLTWNKVMTYGTLLVLPVVAIFVFLQKYMVSGLTGGAVKG